MNSKVLKLACRAGQMKEKRKRQINKPWLSNAKITSSKRRKQLFKTHFLSKNRKKIQMYKTYIATIIHNYFKLRFNKRKDHLKTIWS